ncbi:hypothetical protein [Rhizobium sp. Leaf341]|uniref:hypothetical protein n=1 Tax=Rhizobium sp. Leaf341 TaxID=1736344 RepID=UPI000A595879|nr:hypothetical protein [Rhizobium sp. Leaf341]
MRIEFYDHEGNKVRVDILDTDDHWEACEWGFNELHTEALQDAEDYQVFEK